MRRQAKRTTDDQALRLLDKPMGPPRKPPTRTQGRLGDKAEQILFLVLVALLILTFIGMILVGGPASG